MFAAIFMSSSIVAMFLLIWFRSDAYLEYCRLFKLDFISHYKDYDEKRKDDVSLDYHKYLRQYHDSFVTRLITCPICTAVWLSVLIGIFVAKLAAIPVACVGGLILYGVVNRLLE